MNPPPNEPDPYPEDPPGRRANVISLMRLDQEKRRHYRVHQAAMPTLPRGGAVHGRDAAAWAGARTFASAERVCVSRPIRTRVSRSDRSSCSCSRRRRTTGTLQVAARVLSKHELDATALRYTFVFTQPEELQEARRRDLGPLVQPSPLPPTCARSPTAVPAQIRWPRGNIDGRVIDVSMGGLGIAIPPARSNELEGVETSVLSVVLAENIGELRFAADRAFGVEGHEHGAHRARARARSVVREERADPAALDRADGHAPRGAQAAAALSPVRAAL